jgi:hypothetical protein
MVAYSFQKRFIAPIQVGLGIVPVTPMLVDGPMPQGYQVVPRIRPKTQTIRAVGKRRHASKDDMLQLYYAMRTKQCTQIGTGKCSGAGGIRIFVEKGQIDVEGEKIVSKAGDLDKFALGDGFADWNDMRQFWRDNHGDLVRLGPFVGVLIKWTPPR